MNAVGRVSNFFAQSVYTVSGPFHPFGGAVDIIVVQQEDGSFKSSPWYVKFGKFQGVLKRFEKKVVVAVNDGDANFHMYLDHKGEAYFLKDSQGEDGSAVLSPTEATSSGDELSHTTLAIEFPKGDDATYATVEHAKEESEDERGDDLELRFEGREASKQLIQQSVEERATAALPVDEIEASKQLIQHSVEERATDAHPVDEIEPSKQHVQHTVEEGATAKSPVDEIEPAPSVKFGSNVEVFEIPDEGSIKVLPEISPATAESDSQDFNVNEFGNSVLNEVINLELGGKKSFPNAIVTQAALAGPRFSSRPEDVFVEEELPRMEGRTESSNGMVIHVLLNKAVGHKPSASSSLASAMLASATLSSLRRIVSEETAPKTLHTQSKLMEDLSDAPNTVNHLQAIVPANSSSEFHGEISQRVPVLDSSLNPSIIESIESSNESSRAMILPTTFANAGSLQGLLQSEVDVTLIADGTLESFDPQYPALPKILEVTKMDLVDGNVTVEVQWQNDDGTSVSIANDEDKDDTIHAKGRVESIVIGRKEILEKVLDIQDVVGADGGNELTNLEVRDQGRGSEAGDENFRIEVDKHLVENLNEALIQDDGGGPRIILANEKEITTVGKEGPVIGQDNAIVVDIPEATVSGKEGHELAGLSARTLVDVGSPRLKAALELEIAWRDVMEKAANTLKAAPYASKSFHSRQSLKSKGSSPSENVQKKPDGSDGMVPEQSEKKSWGGWFWGGSSAPPQKPSLQPNILKEPKTVLGEVSTEHQNLELGEKESREQSGKVLERDNATCSGNFLKHGEELHGSDDHRQAEENGSQIIGEPRPEAQLESASDLKDQQKQFGDLHPSRRRSLFGLLSRSTNQPTLSTGSSSQSYDGAHSLSEIYKRETSLERAEIVADLLDANWARGSSASKLLMPIARREGVTTEVSSEAKSDVLNESQNVVAVLQKVDAKISSLAVIESDDGGKSLELIDEHNLSHVSISEGFGTMDKQVENDRDGNLGSSKERIGVGQMCLLPKDSGSQILTATNLSELGDPSKSDTPDSGQGEFISSPNTNMVLMSVDGHIVTAPLVSIENELPQDSADLTKVADADGADNRRPQDRPQQAVCIANVQEGMIGQTSDNNDLQVSENRPTKGVAFSDQGFENLISCASNDSIVDIKSAPMPERLNSLGQLQTVVKEERNPKVTVLESLKNEGLSSESTTDELQLNINKDDTDRFLIETVDTESLKERQSPDSGKREDDCDDTEQEGMERYYSSKDLTAMEETGAKKVFRRTASVYMDATGGDDDLERDGSGHEINLDWTRDGSSPIVIPRSVEQGRSFHSLDDIHLLRTSSESLPNVRSHVINSDVSSPRLQLSRSLDSAPLTLPSSDTRRQSTYGDDVMASGLLDTNMVAGLELVPESAREAERASENVDGQLRIGRTSSTLSNSLLDNEMCPETGFQLSLCRQLLIENMGLEAASEAFSSAKVTLQDFKNSGSAIATNEDLVVRVGGRYYPWVVAAPIVLGILAFGQVLIAPNEGSIPVEKAVIVIDDAAAASSLTTVPSSGWFWPFGSMRTVKTPEKGVNATLMSRDALNAATEAALKSTLTKEYLRMNGYYKRPRKIRTNSPSSQQLASLNLKEGSNNITFTFETRVLGKQQVHAQIFLWKWNTRIVISDVDGTITKSDVLGQFMPLVGKDWTQSGVAKLFSSIKKNGYELMFLSARAISQSYLTRQFLENIKQDGEGLPDGPVVISPDGLFPSLYREVIRRAPHEFKIACLEDIKSLFPPETKPFYAGFGNRDTDELSYLKVGIPKGKIFIINPKGEVVVNNQLDVKSYTSLHKLVDDMFPAMTFTEQEDYNEWNFWKLPLPDVEDQLSLEGPTSKKGGKSSRHS